MLSKQFILPIERELVIDLFAGGGGASTGIEQALGRHVDIAVNHDPQAISLHERNHPQTRHYCKDVFEVDPLTVTNGQPVGLMWASPDCKHFSKAKGGKPVSKTVRGLAWVVTKWAKLVQPRVICLENVEEFKDWGPLDANNMPDAAKKGRTFKRWKRTLENLGYVVEHRELRACDYGAPTIRKRLFLVARNDGAPVVWPAPTHSKKAGNGLKAWRTAAECIDWTHTCPSIFERKKPLADATLRRIAHGIRRYVVENPKPFIVPVTHQGDNRNHSVDEPLRTITTAKRGEFALITPTIVNVANGGTTGRAPNTWGIDEPLRTVTGAGGHALIQTGYGERPGQTPRVPGIDKPLGTCVDGVKHAVVTATLIDAAHADVSPSGVKRWGKGHRDIEQPMPTITASGGNSALVSAVLSKYFGGEPEAGKTAASMTHPMPTVTTSDHSALLTATLVGVGGRAGQSRPRGPGEPVATITAKADAAIAAATLVKLRGTSKSADIEDPLATVSAGGTHHAAVYAFLLKYFGTDQDPRLEEPLHTATTKARFALVTVEGEPYYIADIGLRMLKPRELFNAQSFPRSYEITHGAAGEAITQEAQIRMCGNSVAPVMAEALVRANYSANADVFRRAA